MQRAALFKQQQLNICVSADIYLGEVAPTSKTEISVQNVTEKLKK